MKPYVCYKFENYHTVYVYERSNRRVPFGVDIFVRSKHAVCGSAEYIPRVNTCYKFKDGKTMDGVARS